MKKIALTLSCIFALLSKISYSQSISLVEAINTMENHNGKLKGYEKQAQASLYEIKAMRGLYLPQITLSGKAVELNDNLYLNLNKYRNRLGDFLKLPPTLFGDWKIAFQEREIASLQGDLKWVLYTGGKIRAGNKVAKIKYELTKIEVEKIKSQLISDVSTRYFQVQLAKEALNVRKQAQSTSEKHLYNASELEKNGMIAFVEKMQAETAVSDAKREVQAAEKDLELAQMAFLGVLNIETFDGELTTPLFEVTTLQPVEFYQQKAKENYPEIQKARLKKELSIQNLNVKRSEFIPNIALVGSKYLFSKNLPITEPDGYIGVAVQIDIFNGFKNHNEYSQAKAMSESVDLLQNQAEKDIQIFVKKQYTEILKQQEQLESLKKDVAFAKELVRVREKAFYEGFAKSTDVVDANLYLASIQMKKLKALFEMDKTLAEMLETCGLSNTLTDYIK